MDDRRLRRRVLLLGLTLSVAVICVVLAFRTKRIVCYRQASDDLAKATKSSGPERVEPSPTPFVRAAIPIDQRFEPVLFDVAVSGALKPMGPAHEGELRTYANVDMRPRTRDHVRVAIGIANGSVGQSPRSRSILSRGPRACW
jgi:hypothetical protein